MSEVKCEVCGEPMAPTETMFKFHGYSGPCPKPPLHKHPKPSIEETVQALRKAVGWGESMYGRLVSAGGLRDHDPVNWTSLNEAREILKRHS